MFSFLLAPITQLDQKPSGHLIVNGQSYTVVGYVDNNVYEINVYVVIVIDVVVVVFVDCDDDGDGVVVVGGIGIVVDDGDGDVDDNGDD